MRRVHPLVATHSALMPGCLLLQSGLCAPCLPLCPFPGVQRTRSPLSFPCRRSILHLLRSRYRCVNARDNSLVSVALKKAPKAKEICSFNWFLAIMDTRKCYFFPSLGPQSARCYVKREKWHLRVYCPRWKTSWCGSEAVLMKHCFWYASNFIF